MFSRLPVSPFFAVPYRLFRRNIKALFGIYLGKGYFSLNGLDKKLEKYLDFDGGFFVELGANDGMTQSNSIYFELKRGWSGILVEPVPHKYMQCASVRAARSKVFCNACVGFDFEGEFVELIYADLRSAAAGVETDIANLESHTNDSIGSLSKANERIVRFGAIARPLNDILREGNAPKLIDFLSLDVEGAEMEVLKGIDFDEYSFKCILLETRSFPKLDSFLEGKGYKFVERFSEHDYLFLGTHYHDE
jgi:FkbM family methyltransferase